MKLVKIFTDGSCFGNPGPGGYGILLRYKNYKKILSKGYFFTTNNRMELMAAVMGLEVLKQPCHVILTTDSQYLCRGIVQINNWKNQNWIRKNKSPVLNVDLWKRLEFVIIKHHIKWHWIKGHSGNLENEECDKLAKVAANHPTDKDDGYYALNYLIK